MPRGVRNPAADASTTEPPNDGTQIDLARATLDVFQPDFESLNLWQKIARITGMVGGVEKRGYNAFHKYNYVMEADLVTAVRQYLAAAGIVIIPNVTSVEKEGELTSIMVEYIVTDGKEHFKFSMPGAGADRGDKGVYKAITGSNKYALMKLFKIETGDDPEGDTRVDERSAVREAPRPPTVVTTGDRGDIQRGGHTTNASPVQIRRVAVLTKELTISREELALEISELTGRPISLPDEAKAAGEVIVAELGKLTTEAIGKLIVSLADRAAEKALEAKAEVLGREEDAAGYNP